MTLFLFIKVASWKTLGEAGWRECVPHCCTQILFKPSSNLHFLLHVIAIGEIGEMTTDLRNSAPSTFFVSSLNFQPFFLFSWLIPLCQHCFWRMMLSLKAKPQVSCSEYSCIAATFSYTKQVWCPEKHLFFSATTSSYWCLHLWADLSLLGLLTARQTKFSRNSPY